LIVCDLATIGRAVAAFAALGCRDNLALAKTLLARRLEVVLVLVATVSRVGTAPAVEGAAEVEAIERLDDDQKHRKALKEF
jgi:hypothetical protein